MPRRRRSLVPRGKPARRHFFGLRQQRAFLLAEAAWKRLEEEHAADAERADAQRRLHDLLQGERDAGASPGGLRDLLALGAARRWRRGGS